MGFTHPHSSPHSPFTGENVLGNALELLPCGDDCVLFPLCIPSCLVCPPLEQGLERRRRRVGRECGREREGQGEETAWVELQPQRPGAPRERGPLAVPGVSFPGCFRVVV